ncbi:hypothetical protein [Aquimarina aggregata]|uniref:hypothetical protein n=1 Tax=Aquimarina aggregata TaxID=1642818 RepID=UPI0024904AC4|nr:hypothetical protein [Aquimarina aggregata]
MKNLFRLYLLFIFFLSCKSNVEEKETYEIISLITQEYGLPLPPVPPPPPAKLPSLKEMGWDSIKKLKQDIAVYPILKNNNKALSDFSELKDIEFKTFFEKIKKNKKVLRLDLSKFNVKKQFQLSIIDTSLLKKDKYYVDKNFDKLLTFQNISFNNEFNKAIIIIGVSIGPLNGYSSLVFLEKKNGNWTIKNSKTISIS